MESLFDAADQTTWQSIRNIYKRETEAILPEFLNNLCQFEMEYAPAEEMVSKLKDYARSVVESKAKEESSKVSIHMKERLIKFFIYYFLGGGILTLFHLLPGSQQCLAMTRIQFQGSGQERKMFVQ